MTKLKILIADDEELLQDIYEMILDSEFPCEFIKVSDGESAIAALEKNQDINIIISDYNMPKCTGGAVYLYNKSHQNLPFIFLSGGDLNDYSEFSDFKKVNSLNTFFNKPFAENLFIEAARNVLNSSSTPVAKNNIQEVEISDNKFIKILLSHYAKYSTSSSEVYLKLGENKYTKIVNSNQNNVPDAEQIEHYLKKGIDYVYIQKTHFYKLVKETFHVIESKIISEKKATVVHEANGIKFNISYEGLNDVGVSEANIESVNAVIDETVKKLLTDNESKEEFMKYCEAEGFLVGHSFLITYIAGKICSQTSLNFSSSMKRITVASMYHDYSLFELGDDVHKMKFSDITDTEIQRRMLRHPIESAEQLPESEEIFDETKKIIMEHHELPDGTGYPKKLNANQISPLACLFIISEQISLCLLRNNFNPERVSDFLIISEDYYSQGNFTKIFKAAKTCFGKEA